MTNNKTFPEIVQHFWSQMHANNLFLGQALMPRSKSWKIVLDRVSLIWLHHINHPTRPLNIIYDTAIYDLPRTSI